MVLIVGNTGVGKSSVGCRLLGCKPFGADAGDRPFKVAATSNAVTTKVQQSDGFWLGIRDPGFPLRVVDTPGKHCRLSLQ